MRCLRCQGLLIAIQMGDLHGTAPISAWRCLLCGTTADAGIEANQARQPQPIRNRARLPGSSAARPGKGRA